MKSKQNKMKQKYGYVMLETKNALRKIPDTQEQQEIVLRT